MSWLDPLFAPSDAGVLVLCRTTASVRAVLREIAGRGRGTRTAHAGLHVTTLQSWIHGRAPRCLRDEDVPPAADLPEDHPWRPLLADRPRLTAALRRHVERIHLASACGRDLSGLRTELRALAAAGWGRTPLVDGAAAVLAERHPGPVYALGFGADPGGCLAIEPFERAVLLALGAVSLRAPPCRGPVRLAARAVPDVAAEARSVASAVLAAPDVPVDRVLVLVADTASEERIRAALLRNGVPVGQDGATPLARQALHALLEPLLPAFASRGTDPLHARDLLRLLCAPVRVRDAAEDDDEDAAPAADDYVSPRQVRRIVAGCGRIVATPREWVEALRRVEGTAGSAAAGVVRARAEILASHAEGRGTLGDVAAMVRALDLSWAATRHGRALVAALADARQSPADRDAWKEALARALPSGRVDGGVQILPYASYDDRDCDLLVLTGVHDQGLGATPGPDPFLGTADPEILGLASPRDVVRDRIARAQAAALRSTRPPVVLVSRRDATGRAAGPVVELDLALDAAEIGPGHGLELPLPERDDRLALTGAEGTSDAWTLQVDAEWVREGASHGEYEADPFDPNVTPLPAYLDAHGAHLLPSVRSWLGHVGPVGDGVPGPAVPLRWSASRLTAFTQCMWRAFAESVLEVEEPEELEEDLDASEVGTAVHRALQQAAGGVRWIVPAAELEAARKDLYSRLVDHTASSLARQAEERPASVETRAMQAARDGLASRWTRHWKRYVDRRIGSVEDTRAARTEKLLAGWKDDPRFLATVAALGPGFAKTAVADLGTGLREALVACDADETRLDAEALVARLAKKNQQLTRGILAAGASAELVALCAAVRDALADGACHADGDREVVGLEVAFGAWTEEEAPVHLELGAHRIEIRGSIDVIERRRGVSGVPRYRLGDFKTGAKAGTANQVTQSLVRPQLAFYGLVVHRGTVAVAGQAGPVAIEGTFYDQVRSDKVENIPVTAETFQHVAGSLEKVLDRAAAGAWPLLPHPDGCPQRGAAGAYCDFREVCRLRPSFAPEGGAR